MVRFITLGGKPKEGIMANNGISLARGAVGLREPARAADEPVGSA
jgi:hypothetical protein